MSNDSIAQWQQGTSFEFNNWHPYIHSLIYALIRKIWNSPASICLFQIFVSSFIISFFAFNLNKLKCNKIVIILAVLAFSLSIPVGIYNITLWKDVLFSQGVILISLIITFDLINNKISNKKAIFLPFLLITVSFLRHNGIYLFVLVLFLYFVLKIANFKKLLVMGSISILLFLVIQTNILHLIHVEKAITNNNLTPMDFFKMTLIANVYKNSKTIKDNIYKEKLNSVYPIKKIDPNCNQTLNFLYSDHLNKKVFTKLKKQKILNDIFINIFKNNFLDIVKYRYCISLYGLGYNKTYFYQSSIQNNSLGLAQNTTLVNAKIYFDKLLTLSVDNFTLRLLLWSLFPQIILIISCLFYSIYKKKQHLSLFCYIIIASIIPSFIFDLAGDWRFYYCLYLSIFFLIPLLFIKINNINEVNR